MNSKAAKPNASKTDLPSKSSISSKKSEVSKDTKPVLSNTKLSTKRISPGDLSEKKTPVMKQANPPIRDKSSSVKVPQKKPSLYKPKTSLVLSKIENVVEEIDFVDKEKNSIKPESPHKEMNSILTSHEISLSQNTIVNTRNSEVEKISQSSIANQTNSNIDQQNSSKTETNTINNDDKKAKLTKISDPMIQTTRQEPNNVRNLIKKEMPSVPIQKNGKQIYQQSKVVTQSVKNNRGVSQKSVRNNVPSSPTSRKTLEGRITSLTDTNTDSSRKTVDEILKHKDEEVENAFSADKTNNEKEFLALKSEKLNSNLNSVEIKLNEKSSKHINNSQENINFNGLRKRRSDDIAEFQLRETIKDRRSSTSNAENNVSFTGNPSNEINMSCFSNSEMRLEHPTHAMQNGFDQFSISNIMAQNDLEKSTDSLPSEKNFLLPRPESQRNADSSNIEIVVLESNRDVHESMKNMNNNQININADRTSDNQEGIYSIDIGLNCDKENAKATEEKIPILRNSEKIIELQEKHNSNQIENSTQNALNFENFPENIEMTQDKIDNCKISKEHPTVFEGEDELSFLLEKYSNPNFENHLNKSIEMHLPKARMDYKAYSPTKSVEKLTNESKKSNHDVLRFPSIFDFKEAKTMKNCISFKNIEDHNQQLSNKEIELKEVTDRTRKYSHNLFLNDDSLDKYNDEIYTVDIDENQFAKEGFIMKSGISEQKFEGFSLVINRRESVHSSVLQDLQSPSIMKAPQRNFSTIQEQNIEESQMNDSIDNITKKVSEDFHFSDKRASGINKDSIDVTMNNSLNFNGDSFRNFQKKSLFEQEDQEYPENELIFDEYTSVEKLVSNPFLKSETASSSIVNKDDIQIKADSNEKNISIRIFAKDNIFSPGPSSKPRTTSLNEISSSKFIMRQFTKGSDITEDYQTNLTASSNNSQRRSESMCGDSNIVDPLSPVQLSKSLFQKILVYSSKIENLKMDLMNKSPSFKISLIFNAFTSNKSEMNIDSLSKFFENFGLKTSHSVLVSFISYIKRISKSQHSERDSGLNLMQFASLFIPVTQESSFFICNITSIPASDHSLTQNSYLADNEKEFPLIRQILIIWLKKFESLYRTMTQCKPEIVEQMYCAVTGSANVNINWRIASNFLDSNDVKFIDEDIIHLFRETGGNNLTSISLNNFQEYLCL
jgi:hypothetical protein